MKNDNLFYEMIIKHVQDNAHTLFVEVTATLREGTSYRFKYSEWSDDYNAPVFITAFDNIILIGPNGANIIPPDGRLQSLLFRTVTEQRNAYEQIMESRARDELSAIFLGK